MHLAYEYSHAVFSIIKICFCEILRLSKCIRKPIFMQKCSIGKHWNGRTDLVTTTTTNKTILTLTKECNSITCGFYPKQLIVCSLNGT